MPHERIGRDHGDARIRRIEADLPQDDARLDRLAEADFVREQVADDGIVQHTIRDLGLMLEDFHLRRNERGQAVRELVLLQQFAQQIGALLEKERRLLREFREHDRRIVAGEI